jgi:hypothetical protein
MRPLVTINNFTYRGQFEVQDLQSAICSAFQKKPEGCKPFQKSNVVITNGTLIAQV